MLKKKKVFEIVQFVTLGTPIQNVLGIGRKHNTKTWTELKPIHTLAPTYPLSFQHPTIKHLPLFLVGVWATWMSSLPQCFSPYLWDHSPFRHTDIMTLLVKLDLLCIFFFLIHPISISNRSPASLGSEPNRLINNV